MTDTRPVRFENFIAEDGDPGIAVVPVTQDEYDALKAENERLREELERCREGTAG